MSVLQVVIGTVTSILPTLAEAVLGSLSALADGVLFGVQGGPVSCSPESCPGSQFTQIAAAWANIGYVTHSDVLHYITSTKFGLWAPLIYACAALGALVGVAINMPMRSYMWFFLGPAIYGFLIGTPAQVQGVNWVVANEAQDMTDVWRNAEVGLKNTDAVDRRALDIDGINGPQGTYEVAYPMVFLDEVFSATTNLLIDWLGVYRHRGDGTATSNLAANQGSPDGPWYLLSSLKWGMVENIVGVSARNPDFRDAFVTFLASECGEAFKMGIDSGKYIAAGSPYGQQRVPSVMVGNNGGGTEADFDEFLKGLDVTSIPTPRSLGRLFTESAEAGQFGQFSPKFNPASAQSLEKAGRTQAIVCSEYLYTLIQQIRFEAGHSYWQLVRSSPNGLTRDQFLRTLFYGWNIRLNDGDPYASPVQMNAFVKHLIMVYLLRNELLYAPQITEINQRFAPSEQSRSYSEAYVRTMGSKSKYQELYNWAVLMPHMQGILVYFLVIAYPFAAMVMVLPGHYKTFFTWISFFAWVKLWDVGFAIVMVLERSVWAMIGNNTSLATTANMVIKVANDVGGVGVGCDGGAGGVGSDSRLGDLCPVPNVCSLNTIDSDVCNGAGVDQEDHQAFNLLNKLLVLSASADLDLANGYYIYIMAALYFAVPAVTGQIVLGAKAGAASMLNSAIGGVAGEAGKAAMTGYQHAAVNQALTNQGILGQAAYGKAMRKAGEDGGSIAGGIFDSMNAPLKEELNGATASLKKAELGARAGIAEVNSKSMDRTREANKPLMDAGLGMMTLASPKLGKYGTFLENLARNVNPSSSLPGAGGQGGESGGGGSAQAPNRWRALNDGLLAAGVHGRAQKYLDAQATSVAQGALLDGQSTTANMKRSGASMYGGHQRSFGDYQAQMEVWEAKNQFASHASAMAGIAGMNTGSLSPGQKPADMVGMAMSGDLNSVSGKRGGGKGSMVTTQDVKVDGAQYSGGAFLSEADKLGSTHAKSVGDLKATHFSPTDHADIYPKAVQELPKEIMDVFQQRSEEGER